MLVHFLSCKRVIVSQLPGPRLIVFLVTQKAETRPGIDEDSQVLCLDVWFVAELNEAEILLD